MLGGVVAKIKGKDTNNQEQQKINHEEHNPQQQNNIEEHTNNFITEKEAPVVTLEDIIKNVETLTIEEQIELASLIQIDPDRTIASNLSNEEKDTVLIWIMENVSANENKDETSALIHEKSNTQASKLDVSKLSDAEKHQLLNQLKQELEPNDIKAEDAQEPIDSDYVKEPIDSDYVEIDYTGKD